jgi:hypothetical protein
MIKRSVWNNLDVNPSNIKHLWRNEFLREKLFAKGFVENEQVFTAYKTFTDEVLIVGVEREADRNSEAKEDSKDAPKGND